MYIYANPFPDANELCCEKVQSVIPPLITKKKTQ